jgi:hypothetical protein
VFKSFILFFHSGRDLSERANILTEINPAKMLPLEFKDLGIKGFAYIAPAHTEPFNFFIFNSVNSDYARNLLESTLKRKLKKFEISFLIVSHCDELSEEEIHLRVERIFLKIRNHIDIINGVLEMSETAERIKVEVVDLSAEDDYECHLNNLHNSDEYFRNLSGDELEVLENAMIRKNYTREWHLSECPENPEIDVIDTVIDIDIDAVQRVNIVKNNYFDEVDDCKVS